MASERFRALLMTDFDGAQTALLAAGRGRDNPSGVARRRPEGETMVDEVFTRNLRWEPTDYFDRGTARA